MEFRVLGKLEVVRGGDAVPLGSFRQRSLLGLLLVHANAVVSTDRILDELWGDELGGDRQNALWVHVSNLRSALEPDRPRRSEGSVVLTRAPGYLAQVAPEEIDAWRFEELLREGRSLLDSDPAAASVVTGEALALWRGRAYEDFLYESFAQPEIARLEELRLEAVELRLDADLRRGLASELVAELEGLVRVHPLREQLTAQLMVALYRSGRSSEALRAYQRLRARLADELGIDPSADLQRLETRVIEGDAALHAGGAGSRRQARLAVRGYELREKLGDGPLGPAFRAYQPMVGREVSIRVVRGELADDPAFIRHFEAEAELVARLAHPHVVPLYDFWREPGAAYIVTRLFQRGTLEDTLARGPLDLAAAHQVVRDVASALSLTHDHGVVHGAVTPSSVLVDERGRGYLGNFAMVGDAGTLPSGWTVERPYASPEHVAGGPVTARSDLYGLARVLEAAVGGHAPPALADVVDRATSEQPDQRYDSVAAFVSAVDAALGEAPAAPVPDDVENPYKGLLAFEEADAADFFGRDRVVERLLARLGEGGSRGRLVVLVGPSGSGKSSTVRAGLVPAVRHGALPGSADWFVVDMTPGAQPFDALAAALLRVAVDPPADLVEHLLQGEAGLRHAVDRVLPDRGAELLLVVDQFEELFTQAPEATARAFLDTIAGAVTQSPSHVRVVLTLRADFYDRPLAHRSFGELVRRGTEVITPMTPEELERAVDGPAERAGVRFEPALMAEIVADVADRPGALPLLQFALTELFERRRGDVIDVAAYRDMGGVSGALAHRAEALYADLDPAARATARQALLRLVAIAEDGSAQVARRRVLRQELTSLGDAAVGTVLERFGRHRLLSFDRDSAARGPTVEVAHEALLSEWHRFAAWIDEARGDLRVQRQLAQRADEWLAADRDDGYLLRGPHLDRFSAWASTTDLSLAPSEQELLEVSRTRHAEERRLEEQRQREEVKLRRTAQRRTRLLAGAGAVLAVVVALAAFAVVQRGEAERLADDLAASGEARRLAAASAASATDDPELALLLALQSLETSAGADIPALVEAEEALHWALQEARVPYPVTDAAVETRVGPRGVTGIYRLPLEDLVALARGEVERTFTTGECRRHAIDPCPARGDGLASTSSAGVRDVPDEPTNRPSLVDDGSALAGTTITLGLLGEPDAITRTVQERFEEHTGIRVSYRLLPPDPAERYGDDPPDVVALPAPEMAGLVRSGRPMDLGAAVVDQHEGDLPWGDYLLEVATVDDAIYALPTSVGIKGLVWYPRQEFEAAGYEVPGSWDEVMALSARILADGGTPWCLGLDSGGVGAWPATDWIEGLVLRLGGVALYDRWLSHEVRFSDPEIARATAMFGDVLFGDGFVLGDGIDVTRRDIFAASDPLTEDPPGCWLSYGADYFPSLVPEGANVGEDFDFFVLPPLRRDDPAPPVHGELALTAALTDRPEVREWMRHLMNPDTLPTWAASSGGIFLPAHTGVESERCTTDDGPPAANDVRVRLCEIARDALRSDRFRLDASDWMPPEIGLPAPLPERGAFLQAMNDYATEGPQSLDRLLREVDAAWPADDANGDGDGGAGT